MVNEWLWNVDWVIDGKIEELGGRGAPVLYFVHRKSHID
jgi:hypothetical protein